MKLTTTFKNFFEGEKAGGIILILCTGISLLIANLSSGDAYHHFWQNQIGGGTVEYWINDGLMALFFLLIGLELKREVYSGELSDIKNAMLPILGAMGGMVIPAVIYLIVNVGTSTISGAGIPMATDIAFAIGVLSLLGRRVPASLKIFLTALAVIDDLGAILVITFFYSKGIIVTNLLLSIGIWLIVLLLNKLKWHYSFMYIIGGLAMWWFMLHSGVHATISGVLLAFAIPTHKKNSLNLSIKWENALHQPIAFIVLPLFALANTAIPLDGNFSDFIFQSYSIGIAAGLIIGKPLGIFLLSWGAVRLKIAKLPGDTNWKQIGALGFLGGIGFTMSIFITLLAFSKEAIVNNAKIVIILSSLIAGAIGFFSLKAVTKKR